MKPLGLVWLCLLLGSCQSEGVSIKKRSVDASRLDPESEIDALKDNHVSHTNQGQRETNEIKSGSSPDQATTRYQVHQVQHHRLHGSTWDRIRDVVAVAASPPLPRPPNTDSRPPPPHIEIPEELQSEDELDQLQAMLPSDEEEAMAEAGSMQFPMGDGEAMPEAGSMQFPMGDGEAMPEAGSMQFPMRGEEAMPESGNMQFPMRGDEEAMPEAGSMQFPMGDEEAMPEAGNMQFPMRGDEEAMPEAGSMQFPMGDEEAMPEAGNMQFPMRGDEEAMPEAGNMQFPMDHEETMSEAGNIQFPVDDEEDDGEQAAMPMDTDVGMMQKLMQHLPRDTEDMPEEAQDDVEADADTAPVLYPNDPQSGLDQQMEMPEEQVDEQQQQQEEAEEQEEEEPIQQDEDGLPFEMLLPDQARQLQDNVQRLREEILKEKLLGQLQQDSVRNDKREDDEPNFINEEEQEAQKETNKVAKDLIKEVDDELKEEEEEPEELPKPMRLSQKEAREGGSLHSAVASMSDVYFLGNHHQGAARDLHPDTGEPPGSSGLQVRDSGLNLQVNNSAGTQPVVVHHDPGQFVITGPVFIAVVAGCSVAGLIGLVVAGVCWYRLQKNVKATSDVDYPAYGETGPTKDGLGSPGDRKLAQSAQMYHYQHQKQQMIAMEKAQGDMQKDGSDEETEEENEEGDYTVFECPGLAPTGEMEVKNPLFSDTPVTPSNGQNGAAPSK